MSGSFARKTAASVLVMIIGMSITAVSTTSARAATGIRQCINVPVGTPPVYVDTNNDGNPEFYLGTTGNPTVCVDGGPITATFLPTAGLCGATCVQLTVTVLPAYADVDMTVSVYYQFSDGTYGESQHADHIFNFTPRQTVCIKIGGSGVC